MKKGAEEKDEREGKRVDEIKQERAGEVIYMRICEIAHQEIATRMERKKQDDVAKVHEEKIRSKEESP